MTTKKVASEDAAFFFGVKQYMGKKRQTQYSSQSAVITAKLDSPSNNLFKNRQLWIYAILLLTALAYAPIFSNELINIWDDGGYITENAIIKELNLKRLFTTFYGGNYHPLVALSNAMEYHFFRLNPAVYHFNNLLFHLLNTFLVYKLIEMLTKRNEIAVITALFFGIHPMHVESVAWASERKDVLYSFFYLLAIMSYIKYLTVKEKNTRYFIYTLILCICSLLSKSAAVTFPVLLLLFDWFHKRKFNFKLILEKLPFFALALTFGIIALFSQKSAVQIGETGTLYAVWEKPFLSCYAICLYLYKMFLPVNLSAIYPYPTRIGVFLPWLYYLSPIAVMTIAFFAYKSLKTTKFIVFGLLFFFITIILVLQILPVGACIIAERYTYIPYIGTFLILGTGYSSVLNSREKMAVQLRPVFTILLIIFAVACLVLTFERTKVWERGDVLFLDAVKKYPAPMAYNNLGYYHCLRNENDKSGEYYSKSLALDPNSHQALLGRGLANFNLNRFEDAIRDFNRAIKLEPDDTSGYIGRANALSRINKFEEAISDYDFYIKNEPGRSEAYLYRGMALFRTNRFDEAISDFNSSVKHNPENFQAYMMRGFLFYTDGKRIEASGDMPEAIRNIEKAIDDYSNSIRLNSNCADAYVNRANAYKDLNKFDRAMEDAQKAQSLGFKINVEYYKGGTQSSHRMTD